MLVFRKILRTYKINDPMQSFYYLTMFKYWQIKVFSSIFFIFQDIDSKNFKNILYIKLISLI